MDLATALLAVFLLVLISGWLIYVVLSDIIEDRRKARPYYLDESRKDLTELQQSVMLAHETNKRLRRLLLEIDASRSKDEDG